MSGRVTHYINPKLNEEVVYLYKRKEKLNWLQHKNKNKKKKGWFLLLKINVYLNNL